MLIIKAENTWRNNKQSGTGDGGLSWLVIMCGVYLYPKGRKTKHAVWLKIGGKG